MLLNVIVKKTTLTAIVCLIIAVASIVVLYISTSEGLLLASNNEELIQLINKAFEARNKALIDYDPNAMESFYDISDSNGEWAYKYETKRIKYLHDWSNKQGTKFTKVKSKIKITRVNAGNDKCTFNLICSTEYEYAYEDDPDAVNLFRIVTYHYLIMMEKESEWLITKEWYLDPFGYALGSDIAVDETIKSYILSGKPRDFSNLSQRRIRAVEYADRYCGASGNEKYGFLYNRKYGNYNGVGGDCTNFISQILYEGGKFRKTYAWNYGNGASDAWVRAESFKNYMLHSGRASLIAYGTYDKVFKGSYKLEPGDIISYVRGSRVVHTAIVAGADSKGYTLVNSHNIDGYRVPWDLGRNYKGAKFYLLRVNY